MSETEDREITYTEMYVCRLSLSARPLGRPVHVARVKSENQKALVEVLVEVTERNFYNS